MTRLSSYSNRLHSRINHALRSPTIRRQIHRTGLTTHLGLSPMSMSSMSGPSKSKNSIVQRTDLSRELEDGIVPWDGPSIFSTTPASPLSTQERHYKEERWGQGTSSSPIQISSAEPSPVKGRIRGIPAYNSPLPRTAYTSPSKPLPIAPGQVHPFFNRTRSLPPPSSNRPRMVAHYSSTESSQQTEMGDSQSSFGGPSQSPSREPLERITVAPPLPVIKHDVQGKDKGKGKEKARIPDAGFSDKAIEDMANAFANVEIGRKPVSGSGIKVAAPKIAKGAKKAPVEPNPGSSRTTSTSIPPKPRQKKSIQLQDPNKEYFQYQKCKNPPAVVYTTDPSEANDLIDCLKGDVFGFDLEWPSNIKVWNNTTKSLDFKQGRTALIQICDYQSILLIHLKKTTRTSMSSMYKMVKADDKLYLRKLSIWFRIPQSSS